MTVIRWFRVSDDADWPVEPLWRGLVIYRLLTFASYAVVLFSALDSYRWPAGAVGVFAVIAVWTVATTVLYGRTSRHPGPDRRRTVAVLDLLVTVAVMATTPVVQTGVQIATDAPVMGSVWTSGAALAVAIAYGPVGGLLGAAVISLTLITIKQQFGESEFGVVQVLLLACLTVGYAAWVMRRSAERLRAALAAQGAAEERDRLARSLHDGVLQVLAHVKRRGAELGGPAADLGTLAGEQEVALRALITTRPPTGDGSGQRDLLAEVARLATPRITVSVPATPVELPAQQLAALVAVIREALSNVDKHVGPDAPAWLLVEDLGDAVLVTVRDDGPGIPPGRLQAAVAEGRIGVARSMQGRIAEIGGTISCATGPDIGTEWVIRVPRTEGSGR